MNKIQIKAEILATLTALMTSTQPQASLITDLKNIDDKKTVLEVLIRELVNANEQKAVMICWLLMELIDKDTLNDELWNVIKAPEYNDHVKMIAFNMLKDLGNKIDYEVISGYFEQFNELINRETKQLLETAIMNPEAQIDFMDFLNAISDSDKIILIKSLEEDYAYDALANILIPVFYTILIQKSGIQLWKFSAVLNHSLLIMRLKMQKNMQKKICSQGLIRLSLNLKWPV